MKMDNSRLRRTQGSSSLSNKKGCYSRSYKNESSIHKFTGRSETVKANTSSKYTLNLSLGENNDLESTSSMWGDDIDDQLLLQASQMVEIEGSILKSTDGDEKCDEDKAIMAMLKDATEDGDISWSNAEFVADSKSIIETKSKAIDRFNQTQTTFGEGKILKRISSTLGKHDTTEISSGIGTQLMENSSQFENSFACDDFVFAVPKPKNSFEYLSRPTYYQTPIMSEINVGCDSTDDNKQLQECLTALRLENSRLLYDKKEKAKEILNLRSEMKTNEAARVLEHEKLVQDKNSQLRQLEGAMNSAIATANAERAELQEEVLQMKEALLLAEKRIETDQLVVANARKRPRLSNSTGSEGCVKINNSEYNIASTTDFNGQTCYAGRRKSVLKLKQSRFYSTQRGVFTDSTRNRHTVFVRITRLLEELMVAVTQVMNMCKAETRLDKENFDDISFRLQDVHELIESIMDQTDPRTDEIWKDIVEQTCNMMIVLQKVDFTLSTRLKLIRIWGLTLRKDVISETNFVRFLNAVDQNSLKCFQFTSSLLQTFRFASRSLQTSSMCTNDTSCFIMRMCNVITNELTNSEEIMENKPTNFLSYLAMKFSLWVSTVFIDEIIAIEHHKETLCDICSTCKSSVVKTLILLLNSLIKSHLQNLYNREFMDNDKKHPNFMSLLGVICQCCISLRHLRLYVGTAIFINSITSISSLQIAYIWTFSHLQYLKKNFTSYDGILFEDLYDDEFYMSDMKLG